MTDFAVGALVCIKANMLPDGCAAELLALQVSGAVGVVVDLAPDCDLSVIVNFGKQYARWSFVPDELERIEVEKRGL